MTQHELNQKLQELVRRHGISSVLHGLAEIQAPGKSFSSSSSMRTRSAKSKPSAVDYVSRMTLPSEKAEVLAQVAQQFEDRKFLPSIADIREFCRVYGADLSKSVSRASSIPRIFTLLAAMDTAIVHRLLDEGTFSGPTRLAPIADAIRNLSVRHASPSIDCLDADQSMSDKVAEDHSKNR